MTETRTLSVHPGNTDQARAWDGPEGSHWAAYADQYEAVLNAYDPSFLGAAAIGADDRVLDVGCGTGQTTRAAAVLATAGAVLGVDLSSAMLRVARERTEAAGLTNVRYQQADAQIHPFPTASFDVALSRTSAMFFGDVAAGLANLSRALRPGGRLVLLTWQSSEVNSWLPTLAATLTGRRGFGPPPTDHPGPFALSDESRLLGLLAGAGFDPVAVEGLRRPVCFGPDATSAAGLLLGQLGWLLQGQDEDSRRASLLALRADLENHQTPEGVCYPAGAWLVTAVRAS